MIEIEAKVRKWGNSFGIVIPKSVVEEGELEVDQRVEVFITKKRKMRVKDIFGKLKFREPIDKILRETDEELRGDF